MRRYFGVFNTIAGETVASVMMDIELIKDPEIVDPESLTLRPIANGGVYTLIPLEDPQVTALRMVYRSYKNLKEKPAESIFSVMERSDNLTRSVGRLFDEVEYTVVRNKEDLNAIINPSKNADHEFETHKVSVLDGILRNIIEQDEKAVEVMEREDD